MANQAALDQEVLNYINSLELSTIPITPELHQNQWQLHFNNMPLSSESEQHYEYSKTPLYLITYKSHLPKTYNIEPVSLYALYVQQEPMNLTPLQLTAIHILKNKIYHLYNSLPKKIKSNLASLELEQNLTDLKYYPYLFPLHFYNNFTTLTKEQKINELTTLLMYNLKNH